MRQLIAGNWKMNGTRKAAADIVRPLLAPAATLGCDLLLCPPATLISMVADLAAGTTVLGVGGQDCHDQPCGAHTGDISATMLVDSGARWVILGHSERRANHHETDVLVAAKARAAATAGLHLIICVGETDAQRRAGRHKDVVGGQLAGSLPDDFVRAGVGGVVAYEPIWAIGSGNTATEADVGDMHAFIRGELARRYGDAGAAIRILYGGSVKPANAAALLAVPEVGGALVGGASLSGEEFLAIARAARPG